MNSEQAEAKKLRKMISEIEYKHGVSSPLAQSLWKKLNAHYWNLNQKQLRELNVRIGQ